MIRPTAAYRLILLTIGIAWGLTVSLATIATRTGHDPLLVTYWNTIVTFAMLALLQALRRRPLPLDRQHIVFYVVAGLLGTAIPHALSFYAAYHVPAGIRALVFALIPVVTLMLAIAFRMEQADWKRALGISCGLAAIIVLVGPGGDELDATVLLWTLITLIVPLCYASENIFVAKARPEGLDPITMLFGMTTAALILLTPALPLMGVTLSAPQELGTAELAVLGSAVLHIGAYGGLIYLIINAGSVFASQVSFIVTPTAVLWGIALLDERVTPIIAVSLTLILIGLALIKPREQQAASEDVSVGALGHRASICVNGQQDYCESGQTLATITYQWLNSSRLLYVSVIQVLPMESPNQEFAQSTIITGDASDCLDELDDSSVSLSITSPPYNLRKEYEKDKSMSLEGYLEWITPIIEKLCDKITNTGSICWQTGNYIYKKEVFPLDLYFYSIFRQAGFKLRNRIIWRFNFGHNASSRFSGRYETLLWFTKSDEYCFNLDPVRIPQKYPGKTHSPKRGDLAGKPSGNPLGKNPSDYWEFSPGDLMSGGQVWDLPNVKANHVEKTSHPCQFPSELAERCILALTNKGDLVLDPFVGAGTSVVAAIKHDRRGIGIDRDPRYAALARSRIDDFTNGNLPLRDFGKPITQPLPTQKVAQVPDSWKAS